MVYASFVWNMPSEKLTLVFITFMIMGFDWWLYHYLKPHQ